jgi:hypothetical protein
MENDSTRDLIERYLDERLSAAEREAFEARLVQDDALHEAVELERALRLEFTDPGRRELRARLAAIMAEPVPETAAAPPPRTRFPWPYLAALLALVVLTWWFWPDRPEQLRPTTAPPPVEESLRKEMPTPQPSGPVAGEQDPRPTEGRERQLAYAEPIDIVPNRSFEPQVASGLRSADDVVIQWQQPGPNADYTPNTAGLVALRFAGTVEGAVEPNAVELAIFGNRDARRALYTQPLALVTTTQASKRIELRHTLKLKPGLYYFTIAPSPDDDPWYVGKFTVGVRQGREQGAKIIEQ